MLWGVCGEWCGGGPSGSCQRVTCALPCRDLRRGPVKLGMAKVTHVDFPPREVVSYTKETQTPVMTEQKEGEIAHAPSHTHCSTTCTGRNGNLCLRLAF